SRARPMAGSFTLARPRRRRARRPPRRARRRDLGRRPLPLGGVCRLGPGRAHALPERLSRARPGLSRRRARRPGATGAGTPRGRPARGRGRAAPLADRLGLAPSPGGGGFLECAHPRLLTLLSRVVVRASAGALRYARPARAAE